jgi:hypothetical protein
MRSGGERRLIDACLAADRHEVPMPIQRHIEALARDSHFPFAFDE